MASWPRVNQSLAALLNPGTGRTHHSDHGSGESGTEEAGEIKRRSLETGESLYGFSRFPRDLFLSYSISISLSNASYKTHKTSPTYRPPRGYPTRALQRK